MLSERGTPPGGLRSVTFGEAMAAARSLERLSTGSPGLDRILGGGYQEGCITEVFGASNSGKTQLAFQACVTAASRGWRSVYVDTESTFRPERVVQIAESRGVNAQTVLESLFGLRALDVRSQSRVLRRMAEDSRVSPAKLVIVDTVSKNFTLEFPGKEKAGKRQGALGAYLNRIAVDAYSHRRVVLLTNRVASITRDGVSQDVSVGGLTLERFVSRSIRLTRDGGSVEALVGSPEGGELSVRCVLSERGLE